MGFSDNTYMYKQFRQSVSRGVFAGVARNYGGTRDSKAIDTIMEEIKPLKDRQHTAVFVLTDGGSNNSKEVQNSIKTLEEKLSSKVYGIGLNVGKEQMASSYNRAIGINDMSQLPNTLVGLIQEQFRRC